MGARVVEESVWDRLRGVDCGHKKNFGIYRIRNRTKAIY